LIAFVPLSLAPPIFVFAEGVGGGGGCRSTTAILIGFLNGSGLAGEEGEEAGCLRGSWRMPSSSVGTDRLAEGLEGSMTTEEKDTGLTFDGEAIVEEGEVELERDDLEPIESCLLNSLT
jgi:hypothetical protein